MDNVTKKPQRTCVVCRHKADKSSLLRFVQVKNRKGELLITDEIQQASDYSGSQLNYEVLQTIERKTTPKVVFDELQKLSGRSAYCHNKPECLESLKITRFISGSLNRGRYNRNKKKKK
jgi:predicted RNA-binding protein YlxR (DUF448 family)